jgi:TRAP-type uncharacterized transport system substrate-binding protein
MAAVIKIATIETGGTWGRLTAWLSEALQSAGFTVELLRRGGEIPETALRVESGGADLSVTTTFGARAAYNGKTPYTRRLRISGIAEIQYPLHWFVNMIRADTGITSFEEIAEKKPPLRLCVPSPDMLVSYPVKATFKLFGVDPYVDIPKWGGQILTDFPAAPRLISSGQADGLCRENSPLRYDVSQLREMNFLSLTEEQTTRLSEELSIQASIIKAGTYKNQRADISTLDAEGFTFFARSDLGDKIAYRVARAIDRHTESHYLSSSIFYSPRFAVRTGAPLHEGAARYYREQGYLP